MIEVGEYVRTKEGRIGTFEEIDEHCRHFGERLEDKIYIIHTEKNEYLRLIENDIVKHSKNIIDLIEVRRLCKWTKNWANRKWFFMVWLVN